MSRRKALLVSSAALSALAGWFLPDALSSRGLGFLAGPLLIALQEILLLGLPALFLLLANRDMAVHVRGMILWPDPWKAGLTMLCAVAFTMAGLLVTLLTYLFLQQLGIPLQQPPVITPGNPGELLAAAFCAAIVPALCEELMFRGLILSFLKNRAGERASVWISAILFALLHFSLLGFPILLLIGLLLARLTLTHRSLTLSALFHAMYNFSVLTINYSGSAPGFGVMLLCSAIFAMSVRPLFKEEAHEM